MLKYNTYNENEVTLLNDQPLSMSQLLLVAEEVMSKLTTYRPEFGGLAKLQRFSGCRINELFQPNRWVQQNNNVIQLTPQKGNALRILNYTDIGFDNAASFASVLADMRRLPKRQYERAFSHIVSTLHLYRLYENGFMHPSSHMFRHIRIKQLASQGFEKAYIGTWIGEKNLDNLDYYLNSQFYL